MPTSELARDRPADDDRVRLESRVLLNFASVSSRVAALLPLPQGMEAYRPRPVFGTTSAHWRPPIVRRPQEPTTIDTRPRRSAMVRPSHHPCREHPALPVSAASVVGASISSRSGPRCASPCKTPSEQSGTHRNVRAARREKGRRAPVPPSPHRLRRRSSSVLLMPSPLRGPRAAPRSRLFYTFPPATPLRTYVPAGFSRCR